MTHPATRRLQHGLGLLTLLLALPFVATAQSQTPAGERSWMEYEITDWRDSGWVEFGPSFASTVDATLSTYNGTNGISETSGDLSFKTGFSAQGGFREQIGSWFAGEANFGFLYNDLDSLGSSWSPNATLMQAPFMFNIIFQVPKFGRVLPFIGAGLGGTFSWLDIEDGIPTANGGTVEVDDSSSEFAFAYQGFAGVVVRLNSAALSITYRATATSSPRWNLSKGDPDNKVGKLDTDDLLVQAIHIGFHMPF